MLATFCELTKFYEFNKYEIVISNILIQKEIYVACWMCAAARLNDCSVSNIINTAIQDTV
jgi:hypothetical protein